MRRLREVADELTADPRLVLACQVALDIDGRDFYQRNTRRGKYAFASGVCNARMPDGKIVTHTHAILAWISRQRRFPRRGPAR